MVTLLCTVRGCGERLTLADRSYRCARGHAYDVARSGYVNLLQPQDRRAALPGDSKAAAEARRRFLRAGHGEGFARELAALLRGLGPTRPALLDIGFGEGSYLARMVDALGAAGEGLDISVAAVDLAARAYRDPRWVVANADRRLPYAEGSFDLVTSITARRNGPEVRRVLKPDGTLVVAVPAPDDLAELRREVLGDAPPRDRGGRLLEDFGADFVLRNRLTWRERAALGREALADLLASTYRGARLSQRARAGALETLEVTQSREVFVFTPARSV